MVKSFVAALLVATSLVLTTSAAQAVAQPSIVLVGDSVMLGSQTRMVQGLQELNWRVTFDSEVGRKTSEGALTISVYSPIIENVVIVTLGYNDEGNPTGFGESLDSIMTELADVPRVIWLRLRTAGRHNYDSLNAVLDQRAGVYANLYLSDWDAYSKTVSNPTWNDGIHLRPEGALAMRDLVIQALDELVDDEVCSAVDPPDASPSEASANGYWLLGSDGQVSNFNVPAYGNLDSGSQAMSLQATPTGLGYWIVDAAGIVHPFGDAVNYGDMSEIPLNAAITSIVSNPAGDGYWLMASDGGVFSFGDAGFYGSTGGLTLNAPIISMAATDTGEGYWLVAADGGVFAYGDAVFHGSTGDLSLNAPVSSMAISPDGTGYWLYASDGGVFSFGGVSFHGSIPGLGYCKPPSAVELAASSTGSGYWIATSDGRVLTFGDAYHFGESSNLGDGVEVIAFAISQK